MATIDERFAGQQQQIEDLKAAMAELEKKALRIRTLYEIIAGDWEGMTPADLQRAAKGPKARRHLSSV